MRKLISILMCVICIATSVTAAPRSKRRTMREVGTIESNTSTPATRNSNSATNPNTGATLDTELITESTNNDFTQTRTTQIDNNITVEEEITPTATTRNSSKTTRVRMTSVTRPAANVNFKRIEGKTFRVIEPARLSGMTLAFEDNGCYGGDTKVNRIFGRATWDSKNVNFGRVGTTNVMTEDSTDMRNDGEYINLLKAARTMTYSSGKLTITSDIPLVLIQEY